MTWTTHSSYDSGCQDERKRIVGLLNMQRTMQARLLAGAYSHCGEHAMATIDCVLEAIEAGEEPHDCSGPPIVAIPVRKGVRAMTRSNQPDERGLREILRDWEYCKSPWEGVEAALIAWAERQCERQREECAVYVTGLSDADAAVRATPIVEIDR